MSVSIGSLEIKSSSDELFEEAVRTFPIEPFHCEIEMLAKGIQVPWSSQWQAYVHECAEKKVIPFSCMEMVHSSKGLFVPWEAEYSRFPESLPEELMNKSIDMLFKGGQVHQVKMNSRGMFGMLDSFRKNLMSTLLNAGYSFSEGDFWIKTESSHQHYAEGKYRRGGLRFSIRNGLVLDGISSDSDNKFLKDWFLNLRDKYSAQYSLLNKQ